MKLSRMAGLTLLASMSIGSIASAEIIVSEENSKNVVTADSDLSWQQLGFAFMHPITFFKNPAKRAGILDRTITTYECADYIVSKEECIEKAEENGAVYEYSLNDLREQIASSKDEVYNRTEVKIENTRDSYNEQIDRIKDRLVRLSDRSNDYTTERARLQDEIETLEKVDSDVEQQFNDLQPKLKEDPAVSEQVAEKEAPTYVSEFATKNSQTVEALANLKELLKSQGEIADEKIAEADKQLEALKEAKDQRIEELKTRRDEYFENNQFEETAAYRLYKLAKSDDLYLSGFSGSVTEDSGHVIDWSSFFSNILGLNR